MSGISIDLNVDAGESFGPWKMGNDEQVFRSVTSVNLACGAHAGDPTTMSNSVASAVKHGLSIGAHPGYPDLSGFGRRYLAMSRADLFASVLYQLGALSAFTRLHGTRIRHVKAHGALYHDLHTNERVADAFGRAVMAFDRELPVVVMAGAAGEMARSTLEDVGVRVVTEAFPDRAYLPSGALAPRSMDRATLSDPDVVARRAVAMATGRGVSALGDGEVAVRAETLCLHGDGPGAVDVAIAVRNALSEAGVAVRTF